MWRTEAAAACLIRQFLPLTGGHYVNRKFAVKLVEIYGVEVARQLFVSWNIWIDEVCAVYSRLAFAMVPRATWFPIVAPRSLFGWSSDALYGRVGAIMVDPSINVRTGTSTCFIGNPRFSKSVVLGVATNSRSAFQAGGRPDARIFGGDVPFAGANELRDIFDLLVAGAIGDMSREQLRRRAVVMAAQEAHTGSGYVSQV